MRFQTLPGEESRRCEQFKTTKKVNSKMTVLTSPRQAEVEKIARLRALRQAKEAADKEIAIRDAAAAAEARKSKPRRRVVGPRVSDAPEPTSTITGMPSS